MKNNKIYKKSMCCDIIMKNSEDISEEDVILHSIGQIFNENTNTNDKKIMCIRNFTNDNFFRSTVNKSIKGDKTNNCVVVENMDETQRHFVECLNKDITIDITNKNEFDKKIGRLCVEYATKLDEKKRDPDQNLCDKLIKKIGNNKTSYNIFNREQQIAHATDQETEQLKIISHNIKDQPQYITVHICEHYVNNLTTIELSKYANIKETFSNEEYRITENEMYNLLAYFNIYMSGMFYFREYINFIRHSTGREYHADNDFPCINIHGEGDKTAIDTYENIQYVVKYRNQYYITDGHFFLIISFLEFIKIMRCLKMKIVALKIIIKDKYGNVLYNGIPENKTHNTHTDLIVQLILARDLNIPEYFDISVKLDNKDEIKKLNEILALCQKYYVVEFYNKHKAAMFFETKGEEKHADYIKKKMRDYEVSQFASDLNLKKFDEKLSAKILDNLKNKIKPS